MSASSEDEAPGWDAIDAAIAPLVGKTEPMHWGTSAAIPDQEGLWGVSGYARDGHWFYVTYGLSELFTKVSDLPDVSGFGLELTMRVQRDAADSEAPQWVAELLGRLGELVYENAKPFWPGARMESQNATPAPHGTVAFVTTVAITAETLERMRADGTQSVVDEIRRANPLLVTGGAGTWVPGTDARS
jgi:suppressor of fused protein SUFU